MAVIVQYIVVRDGVQKMTFTTKKEADAYDKMLDISDNLYEFIDAAEMDIDEKQLEDISLFLAENRDKAISILRGTKPKPPETPKENDDESKPEKVKEETPKPTVLPKSKAQPKSKGKGKDKKKKK